MMNGNEFNQPDGLLNMVQQIIININWQFFFCTTRLSPAIHCFVNCNYRYTGFRMKPSSPLYMTIVLWFSTSRLVHGNFQKTHIEIYSWIWKIVKLKIQRKIGCLKYRAFFHSILEIFLIKNIKIKF